MRKIFRFINKKETLFFLLKNKMYKILFLKFVNFFNKLKFVIKSVI